MYCFATDHANIPLLIESGKSPEQMRYKTILPTKSDFCAEFEVEQFAGLAQTCILQHAFNRRIRCMTASPTVNLPGPRKQYQNDRAKQTLEAPNKVSSNPTGISD